MMKGEHKKGTRVVWACVPNPASCPSGIVLDTIIDRHGRTRVIVRYDDGTIAEGAPNSFKSVNESDEVLSRLAKEEPAIADLFKGE